MNWISALRTLLGEGVTGVRDLGGDVSFIARIRDSALETRGAVPDIYFSALMFGPEHEQDPRTLMISGGARPGSLPWARTITDTTDIARAIREAKATGATGIKLYASLDGPLAARIITAARAAGLRTWSHSMLFPAPVEDVIAAAPDELIHSKGFISARQRDLPDSFMAGVTQWVPRQNMAAENPADATHAALYAAMVQRGIALNPALMADGDFTMATRPLSPPLVALRDYACKVTGAASAAGVSITAGTDYGPVPGLLHRELERLVECGLSPMDAIVAATHANAEVLGIADRVGTIEVGRKANLLAVSADPLEDIRALRTVRLVIKDGIVVDARR